MRSLIAFLLLCSSVVAEDIFKPTGRYVLKIETRQRYLVSEPWCVNCPAAKARFIASGNPEANIISVLEANERFGLDVRRIPYEFLEPLKPEPAKVAAVAASKSQARVQSTYCPTGNCPTTTRRRVRWFRR